MEFKGYRRLDGRVGTRNYVGVLSTVVCANEVAERIAESVHGAAAFLHQQGCGQTPVDVTRVSETLVNLGRNPNLAAVLLVSLGCESVMVEDVARAIAASGKRVEQLVIQEEGGAARSVARGQLAAQELVMEASTIPVRLSPEGAAAFRWVITSLPSAARQMNESYGNSVTTLQLSLVV